MSLVTKIISQIPARKKEKAVAMNMVSNSVRNEFPQNEREKAAIAYNRRAWKKQWIELFNILHDSNGQVDVIVGDLYTVKLMSFNKARPLLIQFRASHHDELGVDFYKSLAKKTVKGRKKHVNVIVEFPPLEPPNNMSFHLTYEDLAEAMMSYQYTLSGNDQFSLEDKKDVFNIEQTLKIKNIFDRLEKYFIDELEIGSRPYEGPMEGGKSHLHSATYKYKGHRHKVHIGSRGGQYIVHNSQKIYL